MKTPLFARILAANGLACMGLPDPMSGLYRSIEFNTRHESSATLSAANQKIRLEAAKAEMVRFEKAQAKRKKKHEKHA